MSKTIVVVGATRTQGSGVVNALLKEGFWKVRGIIPNTQGERAKALASQDVEMVSGDSDDVDSLIKAFHGASAIYAVTNLFEPLFTVGLEEALKIDYQQGINLATGSPKTVLL